MNTRPTLLVTGASGQLGRQTIEFLLASGAGNIIAGSRDTTRITDLVALGAEARTVDFDHPETLATAFQGVDRLLLISTDSLDRPGQRIAQHQTAISAAVTAGVKHILYTSVAGASADSAALVTPDHYQTEQAIIASGLDHTILRNSLYTDNLLGSLPGILSSGKWFHAAADGKVAYVTRGDCARAAAAALASGFQGKRILEIGGPALLDHDETAAVISEISGKPVTAVPIDEPSLISAMENAGLPAAVAKLLASFDTAQAKGEYDIPTSAILDLTGTTPQSVGNFLSSSI